MKVRELIELLEKIENKDATIEVAINQFNKKLKHIAEVNINLCFPELSPQARQALVKDNCIASGAKRNRTFAPFPTCPFGILAGPRFEYPL